MQIPVLDVSSLIVMCLMLWFRRSKYGVSTAKVIPLSVCSAAMGLLGTFIMFFIENGFWYGKSFFGAVLFLPMVLLPVALLFKMELWNLVDYITTPGLTLLALFKINCLYSGCCGGKTLWFTQEGIPVHFPSQIVEMVVALAIVIVLLVMESKMNFKGKIYAYCLILYGVSRYVLDDFRWEQGAFLFGLPPGKLWSAVAVLFGVLLLALKSRKKR